MAAWPYRIFRKAALGLLLLIMLLGATGARAVFEFAAMDGGVLDLINYQDDQKIIPYTVTIRYRACTGRNCAYGRQARYRLGISSTGSYNYSRLDVDGLEELMAFSRQMPQIEPEGQQAVFLDPAGSWSHDFQQGEGFDHGRGPSEFITARLTLGLINGEALKKIARSPDPFLRFYINGELIPRPNDRMYPYETRDVMAVAIKVRPATRYRVSGLRDMAMDTRDFPGAGDYSDQMAFCVYVSEAPRYFIMRVWGGNELGRFVLRNGEHSLPYQVQLADSLEALDGAPARSDVIELARDNGNDRPDCNGYTDNNAAIRVRVRRSDIQAPGIYTDTLTILISAS